MNMKPWIGLIALAVAAGCPRGGVPEKEPEKENAPVAKVRVSPLRRGQLEATRSAYGTVVAAPGEATTYSVSFESRVRKVLATPGLAVEAGTPLLEVEASPDAQLLFAQARSERDNAAAALKLLAQRVEMKLATRTDLLRGEQRVHDAELKMESLRNRGIGEPRVIQAATPGLVSQMSVQPGQIVAAGTALAETIGQNQLTVRLGFENEDAARLQVGQAVRLRPVNAPDRGTVAGHVRSVTRQVNPATRLVDVFVAPPAGAKLLLNEYIAGQIVTVAPAALVAPRAAALPEAGHFVLFTVEKDYAVKHSVTVGLENAQEVQVTGAGLQAGQPVVVVGNSELQDGMAVEVEPDQ